MTERKKLKQCLICLICLLFVTGCGKEESVNTIPWSSVNFKIDASASGQDHTLSVPNNYKIFTRADIRLAGEAVGFSGLLVYCSPIFDTNTGFYKLCVFDLCCPHESERNTIISMQSDGTAKCARCGSVYDIINGLGNVISGPSDKKLQMYYYTPASSQPGVFHIYH